MKQLIKDRKFLITTLSLTIICIFTLTIAYSALNAVLTIQGNAEITASTWDIYLDNPRVTIGSATTDVPEIKTKNSVEFSTTLNLPGDFYEFTVDVVNAGSIDAIIENVIKTPELTTDQAKFLKYEITYQNGESITTKQILAKETTMPIRVRIEYRKDLSNTDLPTSQLVLDLSLTLEYIQSDGTGSTVTNNGAWPIASGDINEIGTIVTIGSEQFYTIGTEGDNVKLLSMYNLMVGNKTLGWQSGAGIVEPLANPTGKQDPTALGAEVAEYPYIATTDFNSAIQYANDYKYILEEFGIAVIESRLITIEELTESNTLACTTYGSCSELYPWLSATYYWTGSAFGEFAWRVETSIICEYYTWDNYRAGVRPVVVISKDYFN